MITLHLTRADDDEGVYLKLPSSPAEIGEVFAELDSISMDICTTKITEAISNVYNLSGYLKNVDIEKPGELDKISTLAQRMQTMDRDSCYLFEGVLDANSVNGLDDILRLSESLTDYTLLPDAATASTLGKYLVRNDIVHFPESVQPYLDYQIIGSEFCADHGGAFCRGGYAVRKDELSERFLQTEQKQKSIMLLRLRASNDKARTPVDTTLTLPTSDDELDRAKQRLGIDEFVEAEIVTVDYVFPYFSTMVPQDCITAEGANELAQAIEQMSQTDGEMLKYLAVLEVEQPDTFQGALCIAMNLDDYERVPTDREEYGRKVLMEAGERNVNMLDDIDGFMDYEAYGKYRMEIDGVIQTEFGLVLCKSDPFPEQTPGIMKME